MNSSHILHVKVSWLKTGDTGKGNKNQTNLVGKIVSVDRKVLQNYMQKYFSKRLNINNSTAFDHQIGLPVIIIKK